MTNIVSDPLQEERSQAANGEFKLAVDAMVASYVALIKRHRGDTYTIAASDMKQMRKDVQDRLRAAAG